MPDISNYGVQALRNRLTVQGRLVAQTALRIGSGRSNAISGSDLPVLRDALDLPFIPGASLKGAFRAQVETLIRAVAPDEALDLQRIEERTSDLRKRKADNQWDEAAFDAAIWQQATLIDKTFGAPEIAGRLFFKDALVDPSLWFGQFEIRNGVALNRDTETAQDRQLYDYEVVPAGTPFHFHMVLENTQEWQLGMVLLALHAWEQGDMQIGGFRTRGLGWVQLENVSRRYIEIGSGKAGVDALLRLCGYGNEGASEVVPADDPRIDTWMHAFRDKLVDCIEEGSTHA